jgi:ubiquinone/menaquinone biosynthesis C-methylase UbiE
MKHDLFFLKKAKEFDIDKMEIHPLIKSKWNKLCEAYTNNPNQYKKAVQMRLDIVEFKKGIKILDVGCDVGRTIIEMAYLGANCTGLDAAKDAIRLINTVRDVYKLNVTGIYGDACNLPFDNETFDVVMSEEFFEHVTDINLAMKEQIRVLKRGGRLVIEQTNFLNPFVLFDLLVKYPRRTHGNYGGIRWLFTKSKVKENIYGTGWTGKDEDIHTRLWWRIKMKHYPNLEVEEFTSFLVKKRGHFFRLLEPFMSNILIIARKR